MPRETSRRGKPKLLVAGLLFIFFLGIAIAAVSLSRTSEILLAELPESIDIGELRLGEKRSVEVEVVSLAPGPLQIFARADCTCMTVRPPKAEAARGDRVVFEISIAPPSAVPTTAEIFERQVLFECRSSENSAVYSTVLRGVRTDPIVSLGNTALLTIESRPQSRLSISLQCAKHFSITNAQIGSGSVFRITGMNKSGPHTTLELTNDNWIEQSAVEAEIALQVINSHENSGERTVNLRIPVNVNLPISMSSDRLMLQSGVPSDEIRLGVRHGFSLLHVAPSKVPNEFEFESIGPEKFRFSPVQLMSKSNLQNTILTLNAEQVFILVTVQDQEGGQRSFRLPLTLLTAEKSR